LEQDVHKANPPDRGAGGAGRTHEHLDRTSEAARLRKIAHDMRSSIGAIQMWTHLLKEGQLGPEDVARAIGTIEKSATALEEQVRTLLADH